MKSEPYLWLHLAGSAAFPLFLQLAWVGLAVGDPLPVIWLEWLFLGLIAILPILWMQWFKPFDIFSLLIVSLKPETLTTDRLKILALFKRPVHRLVTLFGVLLLIVAFRQIYYLSPLAAPVASFLPPWRLLGLTIAAISLFFGHLFLQVPLSVISVLLTKDESYDRVEPIEVEKIPRMFTLLGFKVNKIIEIEPS